MPLFILKMGLSFWLCPCFWRELDCTASNFRGLLGSFYIVKRHLKCVQNLRSRSDVSKNGVKKSNWIKNDRLMELWKFLTFTNPSSDGGTHIQWSIMFHCLSYQQSSQIQVLSSDQPKLLSRFVIVDDHFIRNIIQHLTKIVDQLPHHPQFWKNSSRTQGLGGKVFLGGKKTQKPANFFLRLPDTCKKYILQKNWVKTALPGLGSGRNNLQTAIWGHSRQLDDQHRNPNMNNRDHPDGN